MKAGAALQSSRLASDLQREFPGIDITKIRAVLAVFFWQWYRDNKNDTLFKRGFFIFKVTVKVKDLHQIFTVLFGHDPLPRVGE